MTRDAGLLLAQVDEPLIVVADSNANDDDDDEMPSLEPATHKPADAALLEIQTVEAPVFGAPGVFDSHLHVLIARLCFSSRARRTRL